ADAQSPTKGVKALDDTLRMFYGNPLADTFMNWGWWDTQGNTPPYQMIVTTNGAGGYTLTALGQKWVDLMKAFNTQSPASVNADGTLNFTGDDGTYNLTAGGVPYAVVKLAKQLTSSLNDGNIDGVSTVETNLWYRGDVNLDGKLTGADLQALIAAM